MRNPLNETTDLMTERLLTIAEVKRLVGVRANSTIYLWLEKGRLPKPRKLGVNRWAESEIRAFLASREAA